VISRRTFNVVLLLVIVAAGVFGQTTETADSPIVETPKWALDLRRAEIVATGSFPLTLLAARLSYSLLRFTVHSIQDGAIATAYAPWFLAPPGSPELELAEKLGIVAGAVGLSSLIAWVDYRRGVDEAVGVEEADAEQ